MTAVCGTGLNTTLNRPQAPEKSRFQIAWPGSLSSAGCSTRRISGRRSSHARDLQGGGLMPREPHAHGAQAAQAQIHVVGADAQSHGLHGVA